MRRWVERTLGPVVDGLFDALERRVTAEHHREAAADALAGAGSALSQPNHGPLAAEIFPVLAARVRTDIAGGAVDDSLEPELAGRARSAVERAASWEGSFESGDVATGIHWIALLPAASGSAPAPWLAGQGAPARDAAAPEPRRLARLDAALAAGCRSADAGPALEAHAEALPPREWFLLRGAHYGTAHLLRALLRLLRADPDHALGPYTREICDRLIRHVEIRRQQSLGFRSEHLPAGADPHLEQTRFALALVEATQTFRDLRYLNTALKLNDWQLRHQRRRSASPTARLHYAVSIGRQERAMREVLGE